LTLPAAAVLAVLLHPSMVLLAEGIQRIYPINPAVEAAVKEISAKFSAAPLWQLIAIAALSPAICEELAFRGFILSGLRKMGHKWGAIVLTSVFFGLTHSLLQQSLAACIAGIVIGYIAVKTGSLLPAMLYHFVHNSLGIGLSRLTPDIVEQVPGGVWAINEQQQIGYHWPVTVIFSFLAVGLLLWFKSLPYHASEEERLQQALNRQQPLASSSKPLPLGEG
jgi:sodium transport system permease protein